MAHFLRVENILEITLFFNSRFQDVIRCIASNAFADGNMYPLILRYAILTFTSLTDVMNVDEKCEKWCS